MGVEDSIWSGWSRKRGLHSQTLRGGVTLVGGTLMAQVIVFAATPVLARIYDADAFGYLSLALASASAVAPAACLKLESALLLPKSDRQATAVFVAAALASALISVACGIVLAVSFHFGFLPHLASLQHFAWWVASLVFLTSVFALVSQLALRGELYEAVARRSVHQAVVATAGQLALFFVLPLGGLVVGQVLGRLAGILPVLYSSRGLLSKFPPSFMAKVLCRYWRFPAIFTPSALLNALGLGLPLLFIGTQYGVQAAGQWGMADRLLAAPVLLIGLATGQVLEARLASHLRRGGEAMMPLFLKSTAILLICAVALIFGVLLLAEIVLPWLLGPGWEESVRLAMILVVSTGFRLVAGPVARVLLVLQRAGANLAIDAMRVLALVSVMALAVRKNFTVAEVAAWITVALCLVYVVTWIVSFRAARRFDEARLAQAE